MIHSRFDPHLKLMVHTGSGQITAEQIISATQLWFSDPHFDPQMPVLWDISDAMLDISMEEMRGLYQRVRGAVDSKRTGGKTAWTHPSAMIRAMIKVVRNEFDWGSDWRTFDVREDAIEWCCRGGAVER